MKKSFLLCICLLIIIFGFSQKSKIIVPPAFEYSPTEFDSFIVDNMVRPNKALLYGINADIAVKFIINADRTLDSVEVLSYNRDYFYITNNKPKIDFESIDNEYKNEAIRIIKFSQGLWIPLQIDSFYVKSPKVVKISFKTENYDKRKRELKATHTTEDLFFLLDEHNYSSKKDIPYTSPDKYYNLGVKKTTEKKYLIAKKYFLETLKLKNDDVDALFNLGQVYYKLGDKESFCKYMTQASNLGDAEAKSLINKFCK
jgi:tetratricopeptide (TPR) repeat protein